MALFLLSLVVLLNFYKVSLFSEQPTQLTLDVLYEQVKSLVNEHAAISSLMEIGRSVENRPIYAVKIQKGACQNSTVILEFGIHARELASPAAALFLLERFLTQPACEGLLARIKWYVIPVLNPDGYKYVVDTGELWRKNRASIANSNCVGIDLNRNLPVGWENHTRSCYFCSEIYCGRMPLSEPESIALKTFVDGVIRKENVKAYLAVHSCAGGMFFPYGYKSEKADNYVELEKVGELMASSIKKVAGVEYAVLPAHMLGIGGGGVDDWVYDSYHIPLVYTLELGSEERLPPARCFFPSVLGTQRLVRECYAGVEALALYIAPDALTQQASQICRAPGGDASVVPAIPALIVPSYILILAL